VVTIKTFVVSETLALQLMVFRSAPFQGLPSYNILLLSQNTCEYGWACGISDVGILANMRVSVRISILGAWFPDFPISSKVWFTQEPIVDNRVW